MSGSLGGEVRKNWISTPTMDLGQRRKVDSTTQCKVETCSLNGEAGQKRKTLSREASARNVKTKPIAEEKMSLPNKRNEEMHDEKRPGDVLKVPGDPLDDVADDARYGIYTFITTTEKPRELVVAESIRRLAEQGDLTSAFIRGQQMITESQVQFQPARLRRGRICTTSGCCNGNALVYESGCASRKG